MSASRRRAARIVPPRLHPLLRRVRGWAWRIRDELHALRWHLRRRSPTAPRSDVGRRDHVLVIDATSPEAERDAGSGFMLAIMRLLREEHHPVTFLSSDRRMPEVSAAALRKIGVEPGQDGLDVLDWLLVHGDELSHAIVARPDSAVRHVPRIRRWSRARVLYYTHDLHGLRWQRHHELTGEADALHAARRFRDVETVALRSADLVLTPSSAEVPEIALVAPGVPARVIAPIVEVPDGLDPSASWDPSTRRTIVFLGSFAHAPNTDAAVVLVTEIMPVVWERVPDARVAIIGHGAPPAVVGLAGPRVEVAGHVPDLAPYWGRARMSVAPLRFGAGLKGKILTSLAAGVPVVTTAVGNEGIDLVDRLHALVADEPAAFAAAVVELLEDDDLARTLAENGHRFVVERFSVEGAREQLRKALGPAARG
jgi:glycosyltransferase involved in cell wall biosynthesis